MIQRAPIDNEINIKSMPWIRWFQDVFATIQDLVVGVRSITAQTISTDGSSTVEVLLTTKVSAVMQIMNSSTGGSATDFTVGFEAGKRDGQLIEILVLPNYAIEIDPTVLNSASIVFLSGTTKSLSGGTTNTAHARFIWRGSTTKIWYEIN